MTTRNPITVLLVDDEESVLSALQHALMHSGYRVFIARTGLEALDVYQLQQDDIKILITDLDMPGLHGTLLAQQIIKQNPLLPMMFISGGAEMDQALHLEGILRHAFLSKPFSLTEFFTVLEMLLAE